MDKTETSVVTRVPVALVEEVKEARPELRNESVATILRVALTHYAECQRSRR